MKKIKKSIVPTYTEEHLLSAYPGEITNQELLKRFDKYLRDDDPKDQTNFVIKNKYREGYDYKLILKEAWDILHRKYGGIELNRLKENDYYSRKYTVKFPEVSN
jgi:hypothetical protein